MRGFSVGEGQEDGELVELMRMREYIAAPTPGSSLRLPLTSKERERGLERDGETRCTKARAVAEGRASRSDTKNEE